MEHIWSPWRYKYVASSEAMPGCLFCGMLSGTDDKENWIVHRGAANFVVLNAFPYTSGHVMIAPYAHEASLAALETTVTNELMELTKHCQRAIENEYRPEGFNIGFNLGKCAGAGVAGHVHLHVVPRWTGDANFVSVIAETRILPEELETTFARIRKYFSRL